MMSSEVLPEGLIRPLIRAVAPAAAPPPPPRAYTVPNAHVAVDATSNTRTFTKLSAAHRLSDASGAHFVNDCFSTNPATHAAAPSASVAAPANRCAGSSRARDSPPTPNSVGSAYATHPTIACRNVHIAAVKPIQLCAL